MLKSVHVGPYLFAYVNPINNLEHSEDVCCSYTQLLYYIPILQIVHVYNIANV